MPSTDVLLAGWIAILSAGLLGGALVLRARAAKLTHALSYCRRAADGELYVTDPQTGTVHKLGDLIAKRRLGTPPEMTPRQRRKAVRGLRRAIRA